MSESKIKIDREAMLATTGISSIELSKNAKNEFAFTVKIYFQDSTPEQARELVVGQAEGLIDDINNRLIKRV